ncbi:MAG: Diguanylate cyclase, partial [Pseudomonadota bacterium]|nr:Diguanylate cyclase [Pseudomonadota bacterium]
MKSVHRGFSIKLLLVLILATTALLIGLSYILSLSLERGNRLLVAEMHQVLLGNNRQVAQQLLQGRADALNADLGRVQIAMEESSRALSHHLVRGGQMEESAPDLIRRLLRGEGLLSSAFFCDLPAGQCFVLNSDGQHRQSSPKLLLDLQHLLPQLTAPGVARWADLRPLPHLDGGWGVELLAGVYRGEQRVGVIGATIDLTRLNRLLQKNLAPQGSFVLLLDSQLRLLSGSDDALVHWIGPAQGPDSLAPLSSCANPSLLTAIKDLQLAAAGYEVVDLGVAPRLLVQQKLALLDWRLLLAIPQMPLADAEERIELASQTARQQVERLFLFSGIGMVLLVVSFFQLQLRWMTRPIRMLIDAANAFSSGRLERRVEVPRDKELGALLTTFNEMADTVQAKIHALDQANEQLRNANQQLQDNLQASQQLNQSLEQEIERRTDAEKALSLSEIRLQSILAHSPEPIFLKDTRGHYLLVNQAFEKLAGRPTAQIVGATDLDIFPPSLATQLQRHDAQVIAERQACEFEENFGQMNRPQVFLTCRFLLFDDKQRPHALGGIAIDFTRRKLAEAELRQTKEHLDQLVEARTATLKQLNSNLALEIEERRQALDQLRESEARYQVLLDNAWDGVAILRQGELYYANPALVRLLGAQQVDQVMWRSFLEFIDPAQREFIADNYRRRL